MKHAFPARRHPHTRRARFALVLILGASLAACGGLTLENDYPQNEDIANEETGSIFDFFSFGGDKAEVAADADETNAAAPAAPAAPQGLAVNADLWRAALETISFLPLASTDPIGGTIITDWHNDPGQNDERVKLSIVISSLDLRADGLRVSLFREQFLNGRWTSMAASPNAARQLENIILTKARDYYIARGNR